MIRVLAVIFKRFSVAFLKNYCDSNKKYKSDRLLKAKFCQKRQQDRKASVFPLEKCRNVLSTEDHKSGEAEISSPEISS